MLLLAEDTGNWLLYGFALMCLKNSLIFGRERFFPLVLFLNILQKLPQDIEYCFDQANILCAEVSS